jgi:hypothetical protein
MWDEYDKVTKNQKWRASSFVVLMTYLAWTRHPSSKMSRQMSLECVMTAADDMSRTATCSTKDL